MITTTMRRLVPEEFISPLKVLWQVRLASVDAVRYDPALYAIRVATP